MNHDCGRFPAGDTGQRYEIHAKTKPFSKGEDGVEFVVGWCDNPNGFRQMIHLHPGWHSRRVIDRGA